MPRLLSSWLSFYAGLSRSQRHPVGQNIQKLNAPQTSRRASLFKKYKVADINFIVEVNGEAVYRSSDHMPFVDGLTGRRWCGGNTNKVVLPELMGKHIFAYDAEKKRKLVKGELKQER